MMAMAEKAQEHEYQIENKRLAASKQDMQLGWQVVRIGQYSGPVIVALCLAAGIIVIKMVPNWTGLSHAGLLSTSGLGTLIWACRYDHLKTGRKPDDIDVPVESKGQSNEQETEPADEE